MDYLTNYIKSLHKVVDVENQPDYCDYSFGTIPQDTIVYKKAYVYQDKEFKEYGYTKTEGDKYFKWGVKRLVTRKIEMPVVVEMLLTAGTRIGFAPADNKLRCNGVSNVLSITSMDRQTSYKEAHSGWSKTFRYVVGKRKNVSGFCTAFSVCSAGIHCFWTRREAERY